MARTTDPRGMSDILLSSASSKGRRGGVWLINGVYVTLVDCMHTATSCLDNTTRV